MSATPSTPAPDAAEPAGSASGRTTTSRSAPGDLATGGGPPPAFLDGPATRRLILAGACAGALAGCSAYGSGVAAPAPQDTDSGSGDGDAPAGDPAAPPAGENAALASVADIPEGGGVVFPDAKVVITRPSGDDVRVLSAVCTHAGCLVASVDAEGIHCPCHGSLFALDGAVVNGPAGAPLASVPAQVADGRIII